MTNTGGTPAGWYYAPGDPEGTQRYWDGAQWIGEPQMVPQQPAPAATPEAPPAAPDYDQSGQYQPPQQQTPGAYQPPAGDPVGAGGPPAFGAPVAPPAGYQQPPPAYAAAPQGYQPAGIGAGTPAEWGTRFVAWLIDYGIVFGIYVVGFIAALVGGAITDALGVLMLLVAYLAAIGFSIWNLCIKQGSTGQTIGKEKQNIKLVKDDTGLPVGGGMAFVRYLVAGLLSGVTCGIYGLLDYLWPLWDQDKKRLTDKILNMSVVLA
jgi:uncharacterized RDD family membrane protein YckC